MTFSVVDLPAPLGPIRTVIAPFSAARVTSHRTCVPSYPAWTPSRRNIRRLRAEVRLDHRRIFDDLLWGPFRDLATLFDHDDEVREDHDRSHHMLDDQRAEALFFLDSREQGDRVAELVRREPGEDFV